MSKAPIVRSFNPKWIDVRDGRRPLNEDAVSALMGSIKRVGLRTPITVRETDEGSVVLVAGRHRLEAVNRLGLDEIFAFAVDDSTQPDEIRLWEIAENLHRADLTVQERSDQIAEWMRLTAEKISANLAETNSPKVGRPGAIDAARKELGISEGNARRAIKIASIEPEAKKAAEEAGLNTQKARLEIAAQPADKQLEKVVELKRQVSDHKLMDSAAGDLVVARGLEDLATMIVDYMPADQLPAVLASADAAKLHKLANKIRNVWQTGARVGSDAPVFDRTAAGGYR